MSDKNFSWQLFHKVPIIGIIRNLLPQHIKVIASIFAESGLTNLEITMNTKDAPKIISDLVETSGASLNIGAGTVCSSKDLDIALSAGAKFIVTPIINEEVIKKCVAADVPVFPGAYTPSEIYKAWSLGASMVKVFPATRLGPAYIKEILAPLNQIKLLPTGGINLDNFLDFFSAGAKGVGVGSQLFPDHLVKNEKWKELKQLFADFESKYQTFLS